MKIGLVSLGCPKALTDSELILTQLHAEGYRTSKTYVDADLVIVNTCGFIDDAVMIELIVADYESKPDVGRRKACLAERRAPGIDCAGLRQAFVLADMAVPDPVSRPQQVRRRARKIARARH